MPSAYHLAASPLAQSFSVFRICRNSAYSAPATSELWFNLHNNYMKCVFLSSFTKKETEASYSLIKVPQRQDLKPDLSPACVFLLHDAIFLRKLATDSSSFFLILLFLLLLFLLLLLLFNFWVTGHAAFYRGRICLLGKSLHCRQTNIE